MSLRRSNGLYGISVTDAAKQFSQFKQQFAGFESMSSQQQITLATTAGQLEKLGIATGDVIKTFVHQKLSTGWSRDHGFTFLNERVLTHRSVGHEINILG